MVKQFIKGLLGKKGEGLASAESKDEVPDELPPLAEDIIQKKEEKSTEKIPDELPPLEEEPKKDKEKIREEEEEDELIKEFREYKKEYEKKEEKPVEKEEVFKEEYKTKDFVVSKTSDFEKIEKEGKETTEKLPHIEEHKVEKEGEMGFFSELLPIMKEQDIDEGILNQDLLRRMKDYWYFHPQEKGRSKSGEQLRRDIFDELQQLKQLENGWVAQKRFIEEDKRILLEKEREIKAKTEELQRVLAHLKFYKNVPPEKYFWLSNGMCVKNPQELINLLEVIDNKTFNNHVNIRRNDFSEWIKNAVGDKELAKRVSLAKTREEMLVILENASVGDIYCIDSDKYFKMNDGRIIKDIKELIIALKEISDRTFNYHVNNERNDFSAWIRDVFKNDYLADKLQIAKSKKDIIKILEDFCKI